jgi:LacI family transcriptional regulator
VTKVRRVAVIANLSRRFDRRVIQGVAAYVRESGHWNLYVEEEPLRKLPKLHRWDGHGIIADFDDRETAAAVAGLRIPVVGFGGGHGWYDPASRIPYFTTDNEAIGRLAAEHLLDCGFTRLACYGTRRSRLHQWSEQRIRAFQERARRADVPCPVFRSPSASPHNWLKLQTQLSEWLIGLDKPVGLLACTDLRARHVLQVCGTIGARVPDEAAVVGVDNDEMLCELTTPPLTSIEQGSRRIGCEAAALLDRLMTGRAAPRLRYVIPPEGLMARQSTNVVACPDPDLAAAIRFVRDHACDPIKVSDVLDSAQVSRSTLERKFQAALGRTVHAEIQRVQIERARRLLVETNLLVKQVAQRSGFRYVQYMTSVFRRHSGQSPAEYRKHASPAP